MKYLEFVVNENLQINRASGDKTLLISGAVNCFGVHFTFGEEFAEMSGTKSVEFYKNRQSRRIDLVDGACQIPNEIIADKQPFEMRVVSGNMIGTQWASVSITESEPVLPETPEEPILDATEYVKTLTGGYSVGLFRVTENGLEYSQDGGLTWNSGVNGVPDVPARPKDEYPKGSYYARANGDWIRIDKIIQKLQEDISSITGGNAIVEVKVDGNALPVTDGSVDISLSNYATKNEVEGLQVLQGVASSITELDYGETDNSVIVAKINEIISALSARGVISE